MSSSKGKKLTDRFKSGYSQSNTIITWDMGLDEALKPQQSVDYYRVVYE